MFISVLVIILWVFVASINSFNSEVPGLTKLIIWLATLTITLQAIEIAFL